MVHDDEPVGLDAVEVIFEMSGGIGRGIALVATLAESLGIERLVVRVVRFVGGGRKRRTRAPR